jgi:hypothetical protein
MQSGKPAVMKQGHVYEIGLLGGGLEDAVGNDPVARQHAQDFHDGMVTGFLESVAGGVGLVAGTAFVTADAVSCDIRIGSNQSGCSSHPLLTAGLISLGVGVVLYTVGLVTMLRAQPHMYDAINVYNDHVENREGTREESKAPSAPAGAATEAKDTLETTAE